MSVKYNYELIRDYLDGLLEKEPSNEIRDLIQSDETTRDIARGILLMKQEFNGDDEKVNQYLDSMLASQQRTIEKSPRVTFYQLGFKIAAAVLIVAVAALALYQLNSSDANALIEEQLSEPYQLPALFRNSGDSLSAGFSAYAEQNYEIAIQFLEGFETSEAVFIRGLSALYSDNYNLAINLLSSPTLLGTRLEGQGRWFLALAYLKSEKNKEGIRTLESIVNTDHHFKQTEARILLDKLNN